MSKTFEIVYSGFHCVRESDTDFVSDSDEPYFLFSATDGHQVRTRRTAVFEDVDSGESRRQPSAGKIGLWPPTDLEAAPEALTLIVTAMEEDDGEGQEAEELLKKAVTAAVASGAGLLGLPGGGIAGAVFSSIAAELSGLRDDLIGVSGLQLTRDDLRRLADLPVHRFGPEGIGYHIVVRLRGGDNGIYFAFLRVIGDGQTESQPRLDEIHCEAGRLDVIPLGSEKNLWTVGGAHKFQTLLLSKYLDKAQTRDRDGSKSHDYWRWDHGQQATHVVPGTFASNRSGLEFLLYSASDGRYSVLSKDFVGVVGVSKGSEGDHHIVDRDTLIPDATSVVPGIFSEHARENLCTDVLAYRKDGGRQEFYSFDGFGAIRIPDNFKNWRSVWDLVVPIDYPGHRFTSLLLYSRSEKSEIWHMTKPGTIERASRHGFFKTWSFITQIRFGNIGGDEVALFFYSREKKRGQIWSFPSVTRRADLRMAEYELLIPRRAVPATVAVEQVLGLRLR